MLLLLLQKLLDITTSLRVTAPNNLSIKPGNYNPISQFNYLSSRMNLEEPGTDLS